MEVRFVAQADLDRLRWDSCVHYANNGNVFGYSWFLNNVSKEWDALVEGDYESVMPLVWQHNWRKQKAVYQPILARELGVYSIHAMSDRRMEVFVEAIPEDYAAIQMNLNERNRTTENPAFQTEKYQNYQLWLGTKYEDLEANYKPALITALEAARAHGLRPSGTLKPERVADFYKQHSREGSTNLREQKFHALQRIMYNALHRGSGFISGIVDETGDLLAVNFFIYSHGKMLSLLPLESPQGKAVHALSCLMDLSIQSNAGRPLLLDFNTAEADVAQFGASPNHYLHLQRKTNKWKLF